MVTYDWGANKSQSRFPQQQGRISYRNCLYQVMPTDGPAALGAHFSVTKYPPFIYKKEPQWPSDPVLMGLPAAVDTYTVTQRFSTTDPTKYHLSCNCPAGYRHGNSGCRHRKMLEIYFENAVDGVMNNPNIFYIFDKQEWISLDEIADHL